jgi:hypothetical protein
MNTFWPTFSNARFETPGRTNAEPALLDRSFGPGGRRPQGLEEGHRRAACGKALSVPCGGLRASGATTGRPICWRRTLLAPFLWHRIFQAQLSRACRPQSQEQVLLCMFPRVQNAQSQWWTSPTHGADSSAPMLRSGCGRYARTPLAEHMESYQKGPSQRNSRRGNPFSAPAELNRHFNDVYLKKRPHKCPEANCGKACARPHLLARHMQTHMQCTFPAARALKGDGLRKRQLKICHKMTNHGDEVYLMRLLPSDSFYARCSLPTTLSWPRCHRSSMLSRP